MSTSGGTASSPRPGATHIKFYRLVGEVGFGVPDATVAAVRLTLATALAARAQSEEPLNAAAAARAAFLTLALVAQRSAAWSVCLDRDAPRSFAQRRSRKGGARKMGALSIQLMTGALALALLYPAGPVPAAALDADSLAATHTAVTPAGLKHELVLVPAGEFDMGSEEGNTDESPVHRVYLDAYYIDRFPVTNAQYLAFVNARGANLDEDGSVWLDVGDPDAQIEHTQGGFTLLSPDLAQRPVVEVSWYGANEYCQWAGLRLPTEAEWEKAARGEDGRTYPWGEGIDSTRANYGRASGATEDVGSRPAANSPYGLSDMAGNVRNWTADYYSADYYASSPSRNPKGPATSRDRVMRGGGYMHAARELRSSFRLGGYPSFTDEAVGFRCASDPPPARDAPR